MRISIQWFAAAVLLMATQLLSADEQALDSIIAVVNDDIILATDFERERTQLLRQNLPNLPKGEALDRLVFERLIVASLQLQQARLRGIRVDDANLQRTLEDMARNNNLSLSQMREQLARDGIEFFEFRETIRKEMIISTLMRREVESNLRVSDEEVDDYLQATGSDNATSYELEHLLIKLPQQADDNQVENALQRARALASQARDGVPFADLVEGERTAAGNDVEGGNLGWRTVSDLPDLFAGQLPGLQAGDVTEPLRSPAGFHLLKLLDQRSQDTRQVLRVKARHILIDTRGGRSVAEARREITEVAAKLAEGRTFASLASEYSDDPNSARSGGDLGWFNSGEMVPVFERKAFSEPLNQVSEPFQTQFGWHLLEVTEREYQEAASRDSATERARQELRQARAEERFQEWLQNLRDDAYVEFRGFGKNFQ